MSQIGGSYTIENSVLCPSVSVYAGMLSLRTLNPLIKKIASVKKLPGVPSSYSLMSDSLTAYKIVAFEASF